METNFSKELEEKWSSLFNRFDQMTMQHIGEDRATESGLDSHGRLNTSLFYGENTDQWVSEAEKIFSRNRLSEAQKIEAATSCFACETWKWFQEVDQLRPVRTWDELKGLMLARFCVSKLSGEEVSIGRHRSALNWKTMISVQRCQLEKITSPLPSQSSEGRSEHAVEGVSVIGLNHEMKKSEANLVNELADATEIHMNKQVDLVLELAQRMEDKLSMTQIHLTAPGPLRGKPILTPIQANITLPFQSRYSPPNPLTSPNFFTKIGASAEIRSSINGKERVYPSPSPSPSGEEEEERQMAKLPLQLKAGVIDESEQAWEGRLTQLEVVGMIQCGTEHKINSNSRTRNSEILCTHVTGYGVLIDTILVGENSLEHTVACEILPKSDEAAANMENRKLMMEKMGRVAAGKGPATASPETIFNSENVPESDEIGAISESHKLDRFEIVSTPLPTTSAGLLEGNFTNCETPPKLEEVGACNGGSNHQEKPRKYELAGPKLFKPGISDEEMETTMKKREGTELIKADCNLKKKPMDYDLKLGQRVEDQNESLKQAQCPDKNTLVRMTQMKQAHLNFGLSRSKNNIDNPSPKFPNFPAHTRNPAHQAPHQTNPINIITSKISPKLEEVGVNKPPARKEKEVAVTSSEPTINFEIPPKIERTEVSKEDQTHREELGKAGARSRRLKMSISEVLADRLQANSEGMMEDAVINGLKKEKREEMKILGLVGLDIDRKLTQQVTYNISFNQVQDVMGLNIVKWPITKVTQYEKPATLFVRIEETGEIVWEIDENGSGWEGGNKIGWIFNTNNDVEVGDTLGLLINLIVAKENGVAELTNDRTSHHCTPN